jgi:hypothetical protein
MLRYALHKFEPFAADLQAVMGFGCRDACVTVRLVLENLVTRTAPFFVPGRAAYDRQVGNRRDETHLETPPADFLNAWIAGSSYPSERPVEAAGGALNQNVIEFLSTQAPSFALPGPSFGRWAFVQGEGTRRILLVSSMLSETLLSALHMGLFEALSPEHQGPIGSALGDRFETLVGDQFRRLFPPESVRQRVRRTPRGAEADFVVNFTSGEQLVVQCRGRALRQRGRWGDPELFFADIETHIVEAAEQARRFLEDNQEGPRTVSVFIVLDAYFPLAPFYAGSTGRVGTAVRDLPLPCVLSYFDLEYLMGVVDEVKLKDYLEWRGTLLANRSLLVHDEFDAIRAFLRLRKSLPAGPVVDRHISIIYTGFDPRYEEESLNSLDEELGLHFEHTHAPGKV